MLENLERGRRLGLRNLHRRHCHGSTGGKMTEPAAADHVANIEEDLIVQLQQALMAHPTNFATQTRSSYVSAQHHRHGQQKENHPMPNITYGNGTVRGLTKARLKNLII
ncbi:hypothetical protein OUZ56_024534 [Daphnia magna]|uniref:Uncharacterized protein n=1 Tax=Daphnia magna TaxID=35525 RepID=A0ABR0B0W3_9CRUS|nr:hypothetical protein OUZ56_024534 [Daphnia magna]